MNSRITLKFDRPLIMGVLNITPDSFSDGGNFLSPVLRRLNEFEDLKYPILVGPSRKAFIGKFLRCITAQT